MKGRPWYKRYPADILHGTMTLTIEEKGGYSVALDLMYDQGGPIADDIGWLARMCNCSRQKWRAIRNRLIALGKLFLTADGRIANARAMSEIERGASEAESLREAGRRGGLKSSRNADEQPMQKQNDEKTSKKHGGFFEENLDVFRSNLFDNNDVSEKRLQADSETQSLDRKKEQSPPVPPPESPIPRADAREGVRGSDEFDEWYRTYPRHKHRAAARRAYDAAVRKIAPSLLLGLTRKYPFDLSRPNYIPYPSTWLNGESWADEPDPIAMPTAPRPLDPSKLTGWGRAAYIRQMAAQSADDARTPKMEMINGC